MCNEQISDHQRSHSRLEYIALSMKNSSNDADERDGEWEREKEGEGILNNNKRVSRMDDGQQKQQSISDVKREQHKRRE
jgi:hypothetical protein